VADIVRTTLGPRAMLKMLLDANGGIVLTNDGNAILREIDVSHPAAKSIIELSRTQDEEVRLPGWPPSIHAWPESCTAAGVPLKLAEQPWSLGAVCCCIHERSFGAAAGRRLATARPA
jgi:hypothetical protein